MKGQDIVVLLKKMTSEGKNMSCRQLAANLGMSVSTVSESLQRSKKAQLLDSKKKHVNALAFREFLVHGLAYVFPAEKGRLIRGVPTYVSASPIKDQLVETSDLYVWRCATGSARGQQIEPLYPSVPEAAMKDEELYRLLVIADTLRIGRSREKEIAIAELNKFFDIYVEKQQ